VTVEAGELVVRIVGNGDTLERNVTSSVGRASSSVARLGRSIGLAFGGAVVAKGITKTLTLAKDFDLTMRQVGVQTDATGDSLRELSDLALQMGQDTIYSAQEAGSAMLELAKGGLTQAQIEAGALETALTLAAAGNMELADSAAAVVNGLGAFGLKAKDSERVAIALAGAANASSADVTDMTQALAQASAQADATGLSIEEASAALAIFANNGVKGSDAGTSLKTMLQNLLPTTTKQADLMRELGLSFVDANGEFVSLEQIAGRLRKSMDGLSQAQRAQAMRTIFGTDASRAALFLYKAGADGVRRMTKATKDQTAVQDMANAAMEGAAGAWENFKGSVETAAIRLGTKALPKLTELLTWGSDVVASADEWGPGVVDAFEGVQDAAEALWPLIKTGAELVGDLAEFWDDLPAPVKSTAVEAALLAAILPRVAAGLTSVATQGVRAATSVRDFAGSLDQAATRAKIANAALSVAGVAGGLLLVEANSNEANRAVGVLGATLTGAFVGGTLGSAIPGIGTAIGAVGGAAVGTAAGTLQMLEATEDAAGSMKVAEDVAADYAGTLDKVTGAITAQTRELIVQQLQQDDMLSTGMRLGLTTRDLVQATLGNTGAIRRVNKAYADQKYILDALQANKLSDWIRDQGIELRNQRRDALLAASGFSTWREALQGIPKDVRVQLRTLGFKPTKREFEEIRRQAKLTPKQVQTIIKAIGYDPTLKNVKRVGDALDTLGKKKGDLSNWERGLAQALTGTQQTVRRGTDKVGTELDNGTRRAGDKAKGTAAKGGNEVGNALGGGMYAGMQAWAGTIATAAAAIVRQATRAAKAAADSHSPSRVWRDEIGKQMVAGAVVGMNDEAPAMAKAAADATRKANQAAVAELTKATGSKRLAKFIVKQLVDGMVGDPQRIAATADKLAGLVGDVFERRADHKRTDLEKQRDKRQERRILQMIREQEHATMKMARAWEKNHRKLVDARQAVRDLQREQAEYAKSVAAAMVDAANITADMPEGVAVTVQSITDRMREQVAQAAEFAANIQRLIDAGLDQAYIDQLVQAGVAGGAQEAIELAGATPEEIAELNDLMEQLQNTGSTLGQQASDYLYGAGIREAQALVDELERNEHRIERVMRRSARAFVRELRDALDQVKGNAGGGGKGGGNRTGEKVAARTASDQPLVQIGQINNPTPEPASQSVATRLRRLQQTGVLIDLTSMGAQSA
jgi:TP901 family phage tail tape measure protein